MITSTLNRFEIKVSDTIKEIGHQNLVERLFKKDHTIWSDSPVEISNRLGWLDSPESSLSKIEEIQNFVDEVKSEGIKKALLLGMGGSSLAPEVFSLVFGTKPGYLSLGVLDSTDPEEVLECAEKFPPEETLYIVSTKSGGTVETFSFMKFFYNLTLEAVGKGNAGSHFVAITDPGSGLEAIAKELNFRKIFLNDPNIGGRYSVLSLFGMVPAALLGIDIKKLLDNAKEAVSNSEKRLLQGVNDNPGFSLGAIIGTLAEEGIDKLTLILSPAISSLSSWIEQLVAESSGKNGKGILPVVDEKLDSPDLYSKDRCFVSIKLKDDNSFSKEIKDLKEKGFPFVEIFLNDVYDFGKEFFYWEIATAIACWKIGVQPFDQPNVESAKIQARKVVKAYQEEGKLPEPEVALLEENIKVYSDLNGSNLKDFFAAFSSKAIEGKSYISIHAYVKPDKKTEDILRKFQDAIREKTKTAVTLGYGPRFLHSTGQLHKGDSGNGLFIQILSKINIDTGIPDEAGAAKTSMTFGVLRNAQALGDRQALLENKRSVISFELVGDISNGLMTLIDSV